MIRIKNHREILASLIALAHEYGLLSDDTAFLDRIAKGEAIENAYVLFLAAFASALAQYYEDLEALIESLDLDRAVGEDLERLGSLVGVERRGPTRSIVPVVFARKDKERKEEEIRIPVATRLKTEKNVVYETTAEVIIPGGAIEARGYAVSVDAGPKTRIGAGELTEFVDQIEGVEAFNPEASSGGRSAEDDEALRQRIRMWAFQHQRGTLTAYQAVLDRIPGLRSYRIIPRWDGVGTVKIIVDPPLDTVREYAEDALDDAKSADEDVKVVKVKAREIDVHCIASVAIEEAHRIGLDAESVERAIKQDVRVFIDGGRLSTGEVYDGMGIGENFKPFKLVSFISNLHAYLEDMRLEYPKETVKVGDEERATSGLIKIEVTFA